MFQIFTALMIIFLHLTVLITVVFSNNPYSGKSDEFLSPYINIHGSRLHYRSIRECHHQQYGTLSHETYKAHASLNVTFPFVRVNHFVKSVPISFGLQSVGPMNRVIRGHHAVIYNPMKTLSVFEPDQKGGCNLNIRQTVAETAKKNNCIFAVNAGYFDTTHGTCLGNVVSDGQGAHDSNGVQNVNFGLTRDGNIFVGYVSEEMYLSNMFEQLVGGVVWILRNSSSYVNVSQYLECEDTEETGAMDRFTNILSARTTVGHDKNGNIVIVQIDGKSDLDGMSLYDMEGLLKEFGIVNAINLDGGGSSTMVYNDITLNYPYDACSDGAFSCDRKVSTILCVHAPYCNPKDCNGHGKCEMGECSCNENFLPPSCNQLFCQQHNCSSHGFCTVGGCICNLGYYGQDCDKKCPQGRYGANCEEHCTCMNFAECDFVTGLCSCSSGFSGDKCQYTCPYGYFGKNCTFQCQCKGQCYCDAITGSCEQNQNSSIFIAASCLANNIIHEQNLVKDNPSEKRKWLTTVVILGVVTTICLTVVLLLVFCSCSCHCRNEQVLCSTPKDKRYRRYPLSVPAGDLSESSESESTSMKIFQKR